MPRRFPAELARRVRLVVLDADGVLTDAGVYIGQTESGEPVESKRFDITDGLGLKMLEWAGLPVAIVSGRESAATALRAGELGIPCYQDTGAHKLPVLERLIAEHGVAWEEVAFVGDDLPDLPVLRRVGIPVAVANGVAEVKAVACWETSREGGRGAVREFAEALLHARGEWQALVEEYCRLRGDGGRTPPVLEDVEQVQPEDTHRTERGAA
jgi:3-deoxy-D-manno-octulosonate 8-phosphate phosphatase (KDO 8-P phosphatase)